MADIIGKHYLDLDIHQNTFTSFTCKQYNTAEWIYVSVYDNGDSITNLNTLLTSLEVKINTPDNRALKLSTSDTPDLVSIASDVISIHLPQSVFLEHGKAECEIILIKGENQLATMNFQIKIIKSVYSEDSVVSDAYETDAVTELKNFISKNADIAQQSANTATQKATEASNSATTATTKANESASSATLSKSYAIGGTKTRTGEDTDNSKYYKEQANVSATTASASASNAKISETNAQSYATGNTDSAKYYYEQAKNIAKSFSGALRPMGTVTFANLPTLTEAFEGDMYNISDQFITTADFKEGKGFTIPVGANIYKTSDGKWDVLAGTPVTGVKGNKETAYRTGNVNITPANIGALSTTGDASNTTNTFSTASSRTNLTTKEKLSVSLGKITKWFADLKSIAFSGKASDVTCDDKSTLQTKVGAINGITDSLASTSSNVALSAAAGKSLQDQCTALNGNLSGYVNKDGIIKTAENQIFQSNIVEFGNLIIVNGILQITDNITDYEFIAGKLPYIPSNYVHSINANIEDISNVCVTAYIDLNGYICWKILGTLSAKVNIRFNFCYLKK